MPWFESLCCMLLMLSKNTLYFADSLFLAEMHKWTGSVLLLNFCFSQRGKWRLLYNRWQIQIVTSSSKVTRKPLKKDHFSVFWAILSYWIDLKTTLNCLVFNYLRKVDLIYVGVDLICWDQFSNTLQVTVL